VGKSLGKLCRWEDNMKMDYEDGKWSGIMSNGKLSFSISDVEHSGYYYSLTWCSATIS